MRCRTRSVIRTSAKRVTHELLMPGTIQGGLKADTAPISTVMRKIGQRSAALEKVLVRYGGVPPYLLRLNGSHALRMEAVNNAFLKGAFLHRNTLGCSEELYERRSRRRRDCKTRKLRGKLLQTQWRREAEKEHRQTQE